jgi:hypothetical protein
VDDLDGVPTARPIGCSTTSIGHTTVSGQKVYWGPLDTYETLGSGPKGRHVWRCITAPGAGVGAIQLDAFDERRAIPIARLAATVAHAASR